MTTPNGKTPDPAPAVTGGILTDLEIAIPKTIPEAVYFGMVIGCLCVKVDKAEFDRELADMLSKYFEPPLEYVAKVRIVERKMMLAIL